MRYKLRGPAAGFSLLATTATLLHSFSSPTGRLVGLDQLVLSTNSRDLNLGNVLVRVMQYDADGSTGTSNPSTPLDPRITVGIPGGKHSWSGSGAQLPNGNPAELWAGEFHPTNVETFDLADLIRGAPLAIEFGKIAVIEATAPAAMTVYLRQLIGSDQ